MVIYFCNSNLRVFFIRMNDVNLAQIFYWPEHIEYVTDRAFGVLINKVFFLQFSHATCRLYAKYAIIEYFFFSKALFIE